MEFTKMLSSRPQNLRVLRVGSGSSGSRLAFFLQGVDDTGRACYHEVEFVHCIVRCRGNNVRLRALCDGCSRTPPGPEGSNGNEPLRVPQITRSLVRIKKSVLCLLSVVR